MLKNTFLLNHVAPATTQPLRSKSSENKELICETDFLQSFARRETLTKGYRVKRSSLVTILQGKVYSSPTEKGWVEVEELLGKFD